QRLERAWQRALGHHPTMTPGVIQRPGDTTPEQWSVFRAVSSSLGTDHGRALAKLSFVSVAASGLNFISTVLIVARTDATVFATYTVALSLMTVGAAFMDGGLASTFGVLAADSSAEGKRFKI